jgi:GT2 family glycosyltransferase
MIDLSIVIPTTNRAASLASCLETIRTSVACAHEIIVVDGASQDQTPSVLQSARAIMEDRLQVIWEPRREGFVKAANKGFRAARGRYLTWLNDDARPLPGSFDLAIEHLENAGGRAGLAALFHSTHVERNVAIAARHVGRAFHVLHVRGTLYANFGLGRREMFQRLEYFDERYFLNAADPDFSLKVWDAGFSVVPAHGALIDHDEVADERRRVDANSGAADNAKLFAKWDLPDRDPTVLFDAARPCTSRGLRPALRKAV